MRVRNSERWLGTVASMDSGAEKLRSLARQSRALAGLISDRARVDALQGLARLYEKQAAELEARVPV